MEVSVVIPCLNGAAYIRAQLDALAAQQWPGAWEVIVADNGSTDASLRIVEEYRDRLPVLRIVDASDRPGQPHALNAGARAARGEAVLFCDADDVVGQGWLAAMAEALRSHDFVACRIDTRRLNPPWLHWMRPQEQGLQVYRYPPYLLHAGGGTLGVKRAIFNAVGGFDESLPYVHDTDLCWKIQRSGTPLEFVPAAVIHMRMRRSLRGLMRQARAWGVYNAILQMRYRPAATPPPGLRSELAAWKNLLLNRPFRIRSRGDLAQWLWHLGWRLGRLRARVRHRDLPPLGRRAGDAPRRERSVP